MKINVCEYVGHVMFYPGISKEEFESYLCIDDYTIHRMNEIDNLTEKYIRLVRVDMRRLEECYCVVCLLASTMEKVVYEEFEKLRKKSPKEYDVTFRKWVEEAGLNWDWDLFSRSIIVNEIVHWCEDNEIEYEVKPLFEYHYECY